MKRAKAVAALQDAEAPSHSQNGNVDRLEALLGNANTAYDRVETARSAIANPSEFFTAAIGRSSPVYKELFDESDHLKNAGLAEQLYKFAFIQGKAGVKAQEGITNPGPEGDPPMRGLFLRDISIPPNDC